MFAAIVTQLVTHGGKCLDIYLSIQSLGAYSSQGALGVRMRSRAAGSVLSNLRPIEMAPPAYQRFATKARTIASWESATLSIRGYDSANNVLVLDTGKLASIDRHDKEDS